MLPMVIFNRKHMNIADFCKHKASFSMQSLLQYNVVEIVSILDWLQISGHYPNNDL